MSKNGASGVQTRRDFPGTGSNYLGFSSGVAVVYAPEINNKTFLHFSWRDNVCKLRDYSLSKYDDPSVYQSSTEYVRKYIKKEFSVTNRPNIHKNEEWYSIIREHNNKYL
jgi:hypothetical protein